MAKKDCADFENSTKFWICDNVFVDGDVKARAHCRITLKYRSTQRLQYQVKLNHIKSQNFCRISQWLSSYYARSR